MKASNTCLVLDLDDTLYLEYLYQQSGFDAVELALKDLFGIKLDYSLNELSRVYKDVFGKVCEIYRLPIGLKPELINIYRYHTPKIKLSDDVENFVNLASRSFNAVAILTDGRSITQRLKLHSLGLLHFPLYISEEWDSVKPDSKRFNAIQKKYPDCETFCYVGDNVKKDFIAPNSLGWFTVGVRDNGFNIHQQSLDDLPESNLPTVWLDNVADLIKLFD